MSAALTRSDILTQVHSEGMSARRRVELSLLPNLATAATAAIVLWPAGSRTPELLLGGMWRP
jgi:hypothetical protein